MGTLPARLVTRAKIVLAAADGVENQDIAAELGLARGTVATWRQRFATDRLIGIERERPGAATHGFDHDQRRVPLEFVMTQANTLKSAAPAHGNIAPPGYYMLFVLQLGDRAGVFYPSVATWAKLK